MASSWLTNRLYEQPERPVDSATSSAITPALRISVMVICNSQCPTTNSQKPQPIDLANHQPLTTNHQPPTTNHQPPTYQDPPAPPPPLRPPPKPPKPPPPPPPNPPNPPPKPPPRPPKPPPNGPTPLCQPLHGPPPQPRRRRRPRRPAMPLMRITRTISRMKMFPPEPPPCERRRSGVRGAPGMATLRPSPIRPIRRCVPATMPAPYAPCRNRGVISWRIVSPAKPSVMNCSRS